MAGAPLPRFEGITTLEDMVTRMNSFVVVLDERLSTTEQAAGRTPYLPRTAGASTALPEDLTLATVLDCAMVLNTLIGDLKANGRIT